MTCLTVLLFPGHSEDPVGDTASRDRCLDTSRLSNSQQYLRPPLGLTAVEGALTDQLHWGIHGSPSTASETGSLEALVDD